MTHARVRELVETLQRQAALPGPANKGVRKQARKRLFALVAKLQGR